jgi:hypothetical protein
MERPSRYRKKPIEVWAMRYTRESRDALIKWCGAQSTGVDEDGSRYERENIIVSTPSGPAFVRLNDWVIQDVSGKFYPCAPDIFQATHDFIENDK